MIDLPLTRLSLCHTQGYIDRRFSLHQIIRWIIDQTGPIHITLATYSISEEFLNWFVLMRQKKLILSASIIVDHRSAAKCMKLSTLLINAFDHVYLTNNHAKLVLIHNDQFKVVVLSSQNQTRGGRLECGLICTLDNLYQYFDFQISDIINNSIQYGQYNSI